MRTFLVPRYQSTWRHIINTLWTGEPFASLPDIVPLADVAEGLNRSLQTVRRWIADGSLEAVYLSPTGNEMGVELPVLIDFAQIRRVPVKISRGQ